MNWDVFSKNRSILMGFSIVLIVIFHWCENYKLFHVAPLNGIFGSVVWFFIDKVAWIGMCGVEIFLFLSGIGLYFSFRKNNNIKHFYIKNFTKILIPYFLIAIPYLVWQNFFFKERGIFYLLADLSLVTTFSSFNRQSWYVAMILIMYFIFPIIYYLRNQEDRNIIYLLLFMIVFPWLVQIIDISLFNKVQIMLTRIPVFILGVYCGKYVYESRKMGYIFPLGISFLVFLTHIIFLYQKAHGIKTTVIVRYEKALLILLFLVLLTYLLEKFSWNKLKNFFIWFSPITFELYLTHVEIRRVFSRLIKIEWDFSSVTIAFILIIVTSVPISVYVHKISHKYIEIILKNLLYKEVSK